MTDDQQRAAILSDLADVAGALVRANAEVEALYRRRLGLLQRGRALTPPITQRELAATARVTEEAVIQVLRKAQRQAAAANGD